MKINKISNLHKKIVRVLKKEPLTGYQILERIQNTSLILNVYKILDDLNKQGLIKTSTRDKMKIYSFKKK
jgi:DNA-binding PadR family transcriptional regulator